MKQKRFFKLGKSLSDEFMFGVDNPNSSTAVMKLNMGLSKYKPWNFCIPYYKNAHFAFIGINELKYFLIRVCNLTYDDIVELGIEGFRIYELKLTTYSSGLSKFLATYFDDEIDKYKNGEDGELISNFFNEKNYICKVTINQPSPYPDEIKLAKQKYRMVLPKDIEVK